jgi:PAS domain S-box-containing protein
MKPDAAAAAPQTAWAVHVVVLTSATAIAIAALDRMGGVLYLGRIQDLFPEWPRMSTATAAVLCLLGAAAILRACAGPLRQGALALARASRLLAGGALLIGAFRLADHLLGWQTRIDDLWLDMAPVSGESPARMSHATALNAVVLGISLWLASHARTARHAQACALLALLIGWLGLSRYVYGGTPLVVYATMAPTTAAAFVALGTGALCLHRESGLVALLSSRGVGGCVARRLFPAAVLAPLLIGWLRLKAQRAGWFGTEAGLSLFALSCVILFGSLVWHCARALDRSQRERLQAREEARRQQRLLHAIIDNAKAIIFAKDLQGRYVLVNRHYGELLHCEANTLLGRTDEELFPADVVERTRPLEERVLRTEVSASAREDLPQFGGEHTFWSTKCPLRDEHGRVRGIVGICTDITELKHAQTRLQSKIERLAMLDRITRGVGDRQDLASLYDVVIGCVNEHLPADFCAILRHDAVDATLIVERARGADSAMASRLDLAEHSRHAVDANGLARCVQGRLVHDPDLAETAAPFAQRFANAGLRSLVLAPLTFESGVFGVLLTARAEAGRFNSGECEFLRQLGEHVALAVRQAQLHQALQQAYDDLRQTQQAVMQQERLRALGQMASGIAHDINNAIAPALLHAQLLLERETTLGEQARGQLQSIERAIGDIAATVTRMREFSRPREPQFAPSGVQLNELARQVLELTRPRWHDMPQEQGTWITLQTEFAPDLPTVMGIESEIREALINLVFNAVDAMPRGGTLTLRTGASVGTRQAWVSVCDTGLGMDDETRQRCLEPFFTTKGEHGTGLGLPMVYGIMQRHEGDLDIETELGHGTRMSLRFVLPVSAAQRSGLGPLARPAPMRLLLVDDDPMLLKALSDALAADGHQLTQASGGQAGLDAARGRLHAATPFFDAVVTDLGMPHVDGMKVAAGIKALSPGTPVVLLTGWGQRLLEEDSVPHVDIVLAKPPKLMELRAALAKCRRLARPAAVAAVAAEQKRREAASPVSMPGELSG